MNLAEQRGASGVEYGILVAGVAAVIVAISLLLGIEVQSGFQDFYDLFVQSDPN